MNCSASSVEEVEKERETSRQCRSTGEIKEPDSTMNVESSEEPQLCIPDIKETLSKTSSGMKKMSIQGEAVPYRGRRRSLADIKINLFPAKRRHSQDIHPSTSRHFINGPSPIPERRHSSEEESPIQDLIAQPDIPIQPRAMGRRMSIAVDDVKMLKYGNSPEENAERRKSLIENAAMFHDNLSVKNLRRSRRASCSHVLPMKAACSNAERVSDSVSTARKLIGEIDKQRKTEHMKAKHQTAQLGVSCKEEELDNSGNLPVAWYDFKANLIKGMKTDKLIELNRNTMVTSLTRVRKNSDTALQFMRVQPIDTLETEARRALDDTTLSANLSSKCPLSLTTDTLNRDSMSSEQSQQYTSQQHSPATKLPSIRNRSVEGSRQRNGRYMYFDQETATISSTMESNPASSLSTYKDSGYPMRPCSSKNNESLAFDSSACTCQNAICPDQSSRTSRSPTRQTQTSPTRHVKTSPTRKEHDNTARQDKHTHQSNIPTPCRRFSDTHFQKNKTSSTRANQDPQTTKTTQTEHYNGKHINLQRTSPTLLSQEPKPTNAISSTRLIQEPNATYAISSARLGQEQKPTYATRSEKPGHDPATSKDGTGARRTEERIKLRHDHTLRLKKLLKTMEDELPTQVQLQLKQLREEYNQ